MHDILGKNKFCRNRQKIIKTVKNTVVFHGLKKYRFLLPPIKSSWESAHSYLVADAVKLVEKTVVGFG